MDNEKITDISYIPQSPPPPIVGEVGNSSKEQLPASSCTVVTQDMKDALRILKVTAHNNQWQPALGNVLVELRQGEDVLQLTATNGRDIHETAIPCTTPIGSFLFCTDLRSFIEYQTHAEWTNLMFNPNFGEMGQAWYGPFALLMRPIEDFRGVLYEEPAIQVVDDAPEPEVAQVVEEVSGESQ